MCPCAVLQQRTVQLSTNGSLAAAQMTHQTAGSSAGSAFTWFAVMIPASNIRYCEVEHSRPSEHTPARVIEELGLAPRKPSFRQSSNNCWWPAKDVARALFGKTVRLVVQCCRMCLPSVSRLLNPLLRHTRPVAVSCNARGQNKKYSFFTQVPPIVRQNAKHARYATADICCTKGIQTNDSMPLCLDKRTIRRVATLQLIVWTFLGTVRFL